MAIEFGKGDDRDLRERLEMPRPAPRHVDAVFLDEGGGRVFMGLKIADEPDRIIVQRIEAHPPKRGHGTSAMRAIVELAAAGLDPPRGVELAQAISDAGKKLGEALVRDANFTREGVNYHSPAFSTAAWSPRIHLQSGTVFGSEAADVQRLLRLIDAGLESGTLAVLTTGTPHPSWLLVIPTSRDPEVFEALRESPVVLERHPAVYTNDALFQYQNSGSYPKEQYPTHIKVVFGIATDMMRQKAELYDVRNPEHQRW